MDAVGLLAGSGWAAGINLYLVTFLLGLAGRLGWADLPDVLSRTDVMVVAAVFYLIEFAADKVPYLDNLWDVLHTVVRPLGAAALGAIIAGESSSIGGAVGGLVAAALALNAHTAKATTRAAVNTSPEPFSNITLSLLEDGLVAGIIVLAIANPVVTLVVVTVLTVGAFYLTVKLWRAVGRAWRAGRSRFALRSS
jgi:hypothetical protein